MIGQQTTVNGGRVLLVATALLAALPSSRLAAQGAAFDRSKAPAVPAPPAFTMPRVQTAKLPNGITIDLVQMDELPLVEVDLMIRSAGARADGVNGAGLATFTAGMLDEGAGTRDALGVASQAAFLGALLSTSADWDYTEIEL